MVITKQGILWVLLYEGNILFSSYFRKDVEIAKWQQENNHG